MKKKMTMEQLLYEDVLAVKQGLDMSKRQIVAAFTKLLDDLRTERNLGYEFPHCCPCTYLQTELTVLQQTRLNYRSVSSFMPHYDETWDRWDDLTVLGAIRVVMSVTRRFNRARKFA